MSNIQSRLHLALPCPSGMVSPDPGRPGEHLQEAKLAQDVQTMRPQILVVNYGSQYTFKIVSSLREIGYRSAVFEPGPACNWLARNPVHAIILSGGPQSVNDPGAHTIPQAFFDAGVPILAICYGMQALAKRFGGTVASVETERGYGPERLVVDQAMPMFAGLVTHQAVWASHGDSVTVVPRGFDRGAYNPVTGNIAAFYGRVSQSLVQCVQFHPEVPQTRYGKAMLKNFVRDVCGIEPDWRPVRLERLIQQDVLTALGDRHVIIGASGGVDSTTAIRILAPVLGDRLHCVLIDGGQLREGEVEEARRHVVAAGAHLTVIDAKKRFARAFGKTLDAEKVRGIFSGNYAAVFVRVARRISKGDLSRVVLVQATLAPDRIESGATGAALIKTHHNVNLDTGGLTQLHPLGDLFKYEVRALAKRLGLPASVYKRHPFPGPGNFIRLPGLPKTPENLAIVAWAEARVREVLIRDKWFDRISQPVVAYGFFPTVGVKGDARVYKPIAMVRAVQTTDFMTAKGVYFPEHVWRGIETALERHPEISRAVLNSSHKPPATTEFE